MSYREIEAFLTICMHISCSYDMSYVILLTYEIVWITSYREIEAMPIAAFASSFWVVSPQNIILRSNFVLGGRRSYVRPTGHSLAQILWLHFYDFLHNWTSCSFVAQCNELLVKCIFQVLLKLLNFQNTSGKNVSSNRKQALDSFKISCKWAGSHISYILQFYN